MKRHVHMLDLDRPSRPRLRKSSCKDCMAREAELTRLREALEELAEGPPWPEGHDTPEDYKTFARNAISEVEGEK